MPELPEVERVRAELEDAIVGRTIEHARLRRRDVLVLPGDPAGGFSRQRASAGPPRPARVRPRHLLVGRRVERVERVGKHLAILTHDGPALGAHLGMTGQFLVLEPAPRSPAHGRTHVHAWWRLSDGRGLLFRDPRRFGGLWSYPSADELRKARHESLGPDALHIDADTLRRRLGGSARAVKAGLLDQRALAGVGNIYADEALFHADVDPARDCRSLRDAEWTRLAASVRAVLASALAAGGSSVRDYAGADGAPGSAQLAHAVYGRGGLPCPRCAQTLHARRLAQRATVWCPRCQR